MKKKIVTITLTRSFIKTVTLEVEVDEDLVDGELQDFLASDEEIDKKMEDAILIADFEKGENEDDVDDWEYSDPTNNDGGHL